MKAGSNRIVLLSLAITTFDLSIVDSISLSPRQIQHLSLGTGGTTSLHWIPEDSNIIAGTKKGELYHSFLQTEPNRNIKRDGDYDDLTGNHLDKNNDGSNETKLDRWVELESKDYKTKYPIYSTAVIGRDRCTNLFSSGHEKFLCFGSGDRWISVWKCKKDDPENQPADFEFVQKLGPHTGWVKALVYDDRNLLLHSIGCNCIESWDCSGLMIGSKDRINDTASPNPIISHLTKRTIENSPSMGTTLSSDLLCLSLLPPTDETLPSLLVSGGVDGRIHMWLSNPTEEPCGTTAKLNSKIPLHTLLAHDGRVNAIIYSPATKLIYTAGNDGFLCAFRASLRDGLELVSKRNIQKELQGKLSRITVVSILRECENVCHLVLGSAEGQLCFVTTKINEGSVDIRIDGDCVTVADDSMIYSITSEIDKPNSVASTPRIWIGHASGLAVVDEYV